MAVMKSESVGVLLLNLGGPESLEAVEPFLYNLFSDREIIQLPGGPLLQKPFARLIAKVRGPKVRENYRSIGGGSPILELTRRQASALERALNGSEESASTRFHVGVAMRYWHPDSAEALAEMRDLGVRRIVALTLYPQYSSATTGSSLSALARTVTSVFPDEGFHWTAIDRYPEEPEYLEALTDTVVEALDALPAAERSETVILFSAHGLPVRFIQAGDPYVEEIARTRTGVLRLLEQRGRRHPWKMGYQSRTGPVRWIGPYTDQVIEELARAGTRSVLVVPLAFVSDHIETLYEIDLLFGGLARRLGIPGFHRTRMLNDTPRFMAALAGLVRSHLAQQPATSDDDPELAALR